MNEKFWKSIEEYKSSGEFPEGAAFWPELEDPVTRREFLTLAGASLGLAGAISMLNACTRMPYEKIVPYVKAPEEFVPGEPVYYATACTLGGYASGILVESHMGRPTKIEGNPKHPASLGAASAFTQASLLSLYDPERSKTVTSLGEVSTWEAFFAAFGQKTREIRAKGGVGFRILTETVTSPTLGDQLTQILRAFPEAKWHQYEPINRDSSYKGTRLAFGKALNSRYQLDQADVIVSLDSDFLYHGPGCVRYAWDYAGRRRSVEKMNRLYAVEPTPSVTGSNADHRISIRASQIVEFARALAKEVSSTTAEAGSLPSEVQAWVPKIASDLKKHRGSSLIVAGDRQPEEVHALAHRMNTVLGNDGNTVLYTNPIEYLAVNQMDSLAELSNEMKTGQVDVLLILGGNPVYTAPSDLEFDKNLSRVKMKIHQSLYQDETSALCQWHLPATHELESWSDARAFEGTVSLIQPLIAPLYDGKSTHEILDFVLGLTSRSNYQIVHDAWMPKFGNSPEESKETWEEALSSGIVKESALPTIHPVLIQGAIRQAKSQAASSELELVFLPDPTIWDGRFSNNGWLQELLKPLTKITWDNAVFIAPETASRFSLDHEDVVEIRDDNRVIQGPIWVLPGQEENTIALHFGYGKKHGFNAYAIWTSTNPYFKGGVQVTKTGKKFQFASEHHHYTMEGRDLIREGKVSDFRKDPKKIVPTPASKDTLMPKYPYDGYAWGMSIDLNSCIGCGACIIACQAENNIPIVGKDQVARGRAMHWIRVDRYFKGNLKDPEIFFQPVPCMQCERAPCEVVCPVAATVHDDEGINNMVYNRCVGTRYCSNNCPYKVRRFNFLQYVDRETPSLKLLRNPDVSVRSRGIMEKCTYCIQRINEARYRAELEDRKIKDGEIIPACQQTCPAQAIIFGNINDPDARATKLKSLPLNYNLLDELGTKPRTTYLAKLRNPFSGEQVYGG